MWRDTPVDGGNVGARRGLRRRQARKPSSLVLILPMLMGTCFRASCEATDAMGTSEGTESDGGGDEAGNTDDRAQWYPDFPSPKEYGAPVYPVSEPDSGETSSIWEPGRKAARFVYHADRRPAVNVASFCKDALKGVKDMRVGGKQRPLPASPRRPTGCRWWS